LHNANNQRVAKLVNNVVVEKYLWANLTTLLAIYDKDDNLVQRFEYANSRMPISMTRGSNKYYLHYDQVGSLRAVSDSNHNVIKEITYDSFGNILSDSLLPILNIPFRFAGGLYDKDTKLTRFGYRDYDSYTGKWTAKDPIDFSGGDSNLYGYVLNDPINWIDSDGLMSFPWNKGKTIGNGKSGYITSKVGKWYIDKNGNIDISKTICEKGTKQVNRNQVQDLTSKELERALKEAKGSGNQKQRIESNFDAFADFINKILGN